MEGMNGFDPPPAEPDSQWDSVDASGNDPVTLSDFYAEMQSHRYIYQPTGDLWPASSVDARIPPVPAGDKTILASRWIATNRAVEQMTWEPGAPKIIKDRLTFEGGWIEHPGASVFNLYRGPTIEPGDPTKAQVWIDHIYKVYPDDADHIIKWLTHRRQRPGEKINHAIVLGGKPGIGKDTIIEPVTRAVGTWNCSEISPQALLGRFNSFTKSVILRISEGRDLGDVDRYAFYERSKVFIAAPPETLRVDEKNKREYNIPNVCGVVITTNHLMDGIYLPADDRRHFVAWSPRSKEEFPADYFRNMYSWYDSGGDGHVAAFLDRLDISGFDPKAPPPRTPAFWAVVDAGRAPEDAELADVLDHLGEPDAVTKSRLITAAEGGLKEWLLDRKTRRAMPHRMEKCGYVPIRNDDADDGLWKVHKRREVVYGKATLTVSQQLAAVRALTATVDWSNQYDQ
jgi:hypothetical protein